MCDLEHIKVKVEDDMELKGEMKIIEQFIDDKGVLDREEYSIKNEESYSNFLVTKLNAKSTSASSTEETPRVLHPPLNTIYDDIKLEEKSEILDVSEQFIDEKGIHDRDEYMKKCDESNSDSFVKKDNTDQLSFATFTKDIPRVVDTSIYTIYDNVKLEDNSKILDISEQLIDEKRIHERDEYKERHKKNNSKPSSSPTREQSNSESAHLVRYACDNSQTDRDEENNQGRIIECDDHSSQKDNQNVDVKSVKSNTKEHKCSLCEYSASRKGNLKKHVDFVHMNIRKHKCHLCDYATSEKRVLKKHVDSIHLKIKQHKCHMCEHATTNITDLRKHIDTIHLNHKKHKCHLCHYASSVKSKLNFHVKSVHLNIKEHKCHLCEYATSFRNNLRLHIDTIHLNSKKHKCHFCDYAANQKAKLIVHVKSVHFNIKEHKCHLCDHATATKGDLLKHIDSIHLNIRRHKCHLCDYASSVKSNLNSHVKSVHLNTEKKMSSIPQNRSENFNKPKPKRNERFHSTILTKEDLFDSDVSSLIDLEQLAAVEMGKFEIFKNNLDIPNLFFRTNFIFSF